MTNQMTDGARQQQVHRFRHVITELVERMPEKVRNTPEVRDLAGEGSVTHMHIVTLLAPRLETRVTPKSVGHPDAMGCSNAHEVCRVLPGRINSIRRKVSFSTSRCPAELPA